MPKKMPIGTRRVWKDGYARVKIAKGVWEAEHRLIAKPSKGELVHHENEVRADNRPENLEKMLRAKHTSIHNARRPPLGRWSRKHDRCLDCGTTKRRHVAGGRCNPCLMKARAKKLGHHPARRTMTEPCLGCQKTGRKHGAEGLCRACYAVKLRLAERGITKWGTWSLERDACADCGSAKRPHKAKGLCAPCYRSAA